jgi:hypothetical protein
MRCEKSLSDRRAVAFAAALLAITLNFLQPLVHAAMARDGAPGTLWSVFCNSTPDQRQQAPAPLAADKHECCLGLAHAAAFPVPPVAAVVAERPATVVQPLHALEVAPTVGIRDGPHRPRGPPSFV